jgi:hypothetical protein
MKIFFTVLMIFGFTNLFAGNDCKKCDIDKVKIVNEHLDSLTFQMIYDFLCTFDSSCRTNAEFSEWSNETIFKLLDKSPKLFFQVIVKGQVDNKLILREVEGPIRDYDLQKIYNKIKTINVLSEIKIEYLDAICKAADFNGVNINK